MVLVHATAVLVEGAGVLIRGPSGSGKSDLALRLIDRGGVLVADDQTRIERRGGALIASAPPAIAGKLEVRGVGIVDLPFAAEAPLALAVDLVSPAQVERLPAPQQTEILGVLLSVLALAPFEASATVKLRIALDSHRLGIIPGVSPDRP